MWEQKLMSRRICEFAETLFPAEVDGENLVLDRTTFDPISYTQWLRDINVAVNEPDRDFVYRIYGENVATVNGRSLLGRSITDWPDVVLGELRSQFDWISRNRRPGISRFLGNRFSSADPTKLEASSVLYEKLIVPMIWYGPDVDAFLSMTLETSRDEQARYFAFASTGCTCMPQREKCDCQVFSR